MLDSIRMASQIDWDLFFNHHISIQGGLSEDRGGIISTACKNQILVNFNRIDSIRVDFYLLRAHIGFTFTHLILLFFGILLFHLLTFLDLFLLLNKYLFLDVIIELVHIVFVQKDDILIFSIHGFLGTCIRPVVILVLIYRIVFFTIFIKKLFDFLLSYLLDHCNFLYLWEAKKLIQFIFNVVNLFYVKLLHIVVIFL